MIADVVLQFTEKLDCDKCEDVLIWVQDPLILAINVGQTDPTKLIRLFKSSIKDFICVGTAKYQYTFEYDTSILADPETPLTECDIKRVCCTGCAIEYLDERLSGLVTGPCGHYLFFSESGPIAARKDPLLGTQVLNYTLNLPEGPGVVAPNEFDPNTYPYLSDTDGYRIYAFDIPIDTLIPVVVNDEIEDDVYDCMRYVMLEEKSWGWQTRPNGTLSQPLDIKINGLSYINGTLFSATGYPVSNFERGIVLPSPSTSFERITGTLNALRDLNNGGRDTTSATMRFEIWLRDLGEELYPTIYLEYCTLGYSFFLGQNNTIIT